MNILEAIMMAVGVILTVFCAIGTVIILPTPREDDNDQA